MFSRKLIAFFATTMLALGAVATASADMLPKDAQKEGASSADSAAKVKKYLASNQFIASRMELRRIDADPVPELIAIATSKKTKPAVQARAVKCLSLFRDARVKSAFTALLKTSKTPKSIGMVVLAYLEAFGEDAVEDIQPMLTHKNAAVRSTVARGFGMFGGQTGYDLLVEHNRVEQDAKVLSAMRLYVQ